MNEKTYHKMTKKHSLRWLRLFKQEYLTEPRIYSFLAKIKLVREVKRTSRLPYLENELSKKVNILDEVLKTDRGSFTLSYISNIEAVNTFHGYESIFRKRILYIVEDTFEYSANVTCRAQCTEFLVKINPYISAVVNWKHPVYHYSIPSKVYSPFKDEPITEDTTLKKITCNFLNARFGVSVSLDKIQTGEIDSAIKELLGKAKLRLQNYIEGNAESINYSISGIEFDGEFHTKEGNRLMPNCLCPKCGYPVFTSNVEDYTAQCIFCDEDFYSFEVNKVDPENYNRAYENTKDLVYRLLLSE